MPSGACIYIYTYIHLVGVLEHCLFSINIWDNPSQLTTIFQRGRSTTNQIYLQVVPGQSTPKHFQGGFWIWSKKFGYGSIPINTIFTWMNIHLPAILMFTRGTRFWHTAISKKYIRVSSNYNDHQWSNSYLSCQSQTTSLLGLSGDVKSYAPTFDVCHYFPPWKWP